jgi:putative ABC transport system permease protein
MDRFRQDVRLAIRSLIRSPLITTAAILSLGLGIGANASIFSAVDVFMFRPLNFDEADNLVVVFSTNPERGWTQAGSSVPDYLDWRAQSRTLDLASYTSVGVTLTGVDRPERLQALSVTPNFMGVLRKTPVLGRGFLPEEEQTGAPRVAILGDGFWQRRFGGDAGVIGRTIDLDGQPTQIVGVMPEGVGFGPDPDLWVPMQFSGAESRNSRSLAILGRIRDGHDLDEARADLTSIASRIAAEYPATNEGIGVGAITLQDEWFDEGFRQGSLIAGTAVLFVLLIACANVANLLLARAASRAREIALRGALGAKRIRIVRQLLTESMVLAFVGGALGVLFSVAGIRGLRGLFPPTMPGVDAVSLDGRVLLFTLIITLLSGIIFGLMPAIRSARLDLRGLLTDGGRGTTVTRGGRMRNALVVAEISLSLVLLISAALLVQAFIKVRTVDPGFRTADIATMRVTLPESRYETPEQVEAFQVQMLDRVTAVTGVQEAGATDLLPMRGNRGRYYEIPSEPAPEPGHEPVVSVRSVMPGYFETMGIPAIGGRTINRGDVVNAPPVVVINELMAKHHWEGRNPIGERIRFADTDYEIVGVVGDTRDFGPDDEPGRLVYFSAMQNGARTLSLVLHSTRPVDVLANDIRQAVSSIDAEEPVYAVSTMDQIMTDELAGSMAMMKVLASLGLIAFVLAAVGVYGVMAYTVAQRTLELGIRMALGAQRGTVMGLVLRRGGLMTGLGIVIGLGISLAVTRMLSFFLFGVSPFSLLPYTTVPVALGLTGLLASAVPALRATKIDPMLALRTE